MLKNIPDLRYKRMAIGFGVLLIFGILHTYVIFPPLLRAILKSVRPQKIHSRRTKSTIPDMYEALPFPLIFKIYIFNVLNPDEVMKGANPKLQEMGPFVFEEWKTKIDIVEDVNADTLEFTAINTFIYNQTLSNGLTGNEIVTVPHPLILGMALAVNVDRAPMLPLISKAVDEIFHKPETAFWTGKAMDLLFHGIDVDCTSDDFNSKATCSVFDSGEVKAVIPKGDEEDMFLFSILGGSNGTSAGRFKTYRGVKNIRDLGRVIEYNEEPELDVWDGDACNEFRGTESSILPPFLTRDEGIWAFEASICRSMKAIYEKPSKYRGIPTLRYNLDLGDIAADETQHCYCNDDECPLKGTMNLMACVGTPLIASMPHFYNGDPALFEKIDSGLEPDKEKHGIYIDFEIISGTPMSAAKRLQFNIDLIPIQELEIMKELPEVVFPLLWVEEGVDLNKTFVNMLKYQLFLGLKYQAAVKWLSLIVGPIGLATALFLDYNKRNMNSLQVTEIVSAPETKATEKTTDVPSILPKKQVEVDAESASSAKTQELNEKQRY